jgi:hypothetical protein
MSKQDKDELDTLNTQVPRRDPDRSRDILIYQYLLKLTDGSEYLPEELPSEKGKSISQQWRTNKMFVQRVLWNLFPDKYPERENQAGKQNTGLPSLDLDKLVNILSGLQEYWRKQPLKSRKITRLDIVKILRLFGQLSPDQESKLGLQVNQSKILLQRIEDSINNLKPEVIPEITAKIYKYFLDAKADAVEEGQNLDRFEKEKRIKKYLFNALNHKEIILVKDNEDNSIIKETLAKIELEANKIKIENGFNRYEFYRSSSEEELDDQSPYLSKSVMDVLIKSVSENETLTDEFPIYIKYIEVKKNRALPLYLDRDVNLYYSRADDEMTGGHNESGVLNYELHDKKHKEYKDLKNKKNDVTEEVDSVESVLSIGSLKNLFSYTVKVHFYVKLPKDYSRDRIGQTKNLDIDIHPDGNQLIVNFFEEVTGVGSLLAHIIAAINRALIWDIKLLNQYVPIVKNININDTVSGSSPNSTIWGHNVVCLCKRDDVKESINKDKQYDEMFNTQEYACGDYCGFDILEVMARSAFYARLRAIKQTGINSEQYVKQCLNRISEVNSLRKAQSLLDNYPFSSLAMEEYIEKNIFENAGKYQYRELQQEGQNIEFKELDFSTTHWSMVAYEAHLAIAEASLKEGLFKKGEKYLDILEKHIDKYEDKIDSLFIAKYYLSKFRFYFLTNEDGGNINESIRMLKESKKCLVRYTKKCHSIDELPQINFYDFFYISSRLCAHEAKIDLFMKREPEVNKIKNNLESAIYSFEKARIYAARQGNVSLYSMWSAYQAWCYIMDAYLTVEQDETPKVDKLKMASTLLDHALVCYSENGKKCYEAIKTKAGKIEEYEQYDDAKIQVLPLIQELSERTENRNNKKPGYDNEGKNPVLVLDMSIFSWEYPERFGSSHVGKTFLFGMPSTMLLFSLGMRLLCGENSKPENLLIDINKARSFFNYSWSLAEEGLCTTEKPKVYNRRFPKENNSKEQKYKLINEASVIGLYPHRMTQFADFGKIFSIVCDLILIIHGKTEESPEVLKERMNFLIAEMEDNQVVNSQEDGVKDYGILGQEKYNIHLKVIQKKFKEYKERLTGSYYDLSAIQLDVLKLRNKIVREVFHIITTHSIP